MVAGAAGQPRGGALQLRPREERAAHPPREDVAGGRVAAAAFALGLAALGLYGLLFLARLPARLPTAAEWRGAAEVLAREARAGDAVALAPWWAERAREALPSRAADGAALRILSVPRLAGEDLPGVRRVWLLAIPRSPGGAGELARDLAARAAAAGPARRLGALELSAWELRAPVLPVAYLPDLLARAEPRPRGAGFAREVREVDAAARDCLFADVGPGVAARAEWPEVPLGRALRVGTGVVGEAAFGGEATVVVEVAVDGRVLARAEERPRTTGWHRLEADTSAWAGRAARVSIAARLEGGRDRRPVCVEAYAVP